MDVLVDISFLTSHALFGGLNEESMEIVRAYLKSHTFKAGTEIIRENDIGDCLYFITKGNVEITKEAYESNAQTPYKQVLARLQPGDTFGEMELIDSQPRCATVKAIEEVRLLSLSNKDLYRIHQKSSETFTIIILNLARELSRRLRRQDEIIARLQLSLESASS